MSACRICAGPFKAHASGARAPVIASSWAWAVPGGRARRRDVKEPDDAEWRAVRVAHAACDARSRAHRRACGHARAPRTTMARRRRVVAPRQRSCRGRRARADGRARGRGDGSAVSSSSLSAWCARGERSRPRPLEPARCSAPGGQQRCRADGARSQRSGRRCGWWARRSWSSCAPIWVVAEDIARIGSTRRSSALFEDGTYVREPTERVGRKGVYGCKFRCITAAEPSEDQISSLFRTRSITSYR